jgi:hypothetical protein
MKTRVINERILSGSFNERELESIVEAIEKEKTRQTYVKSLEIGDPVLFKANNNSTEIGRIIEINDRRNYFLTEVKRKVRTVQVRAWYKDIIRPNMEGV